MKAILTDRLINSGWMQIPLTTVAVLLDVLVSVIQNLCEDRERMKQKFIDSTHIISYLMSAYTPNIAFGERHSSSGTISD
jgi:hypothetical protein